MVLIFSSQGYHDSQECVDKRHVSYTQGLLRSTITESHTIFDHTMINGALQGQELFIQRGPADSHM